MVWSTNPEKMNTFIIGLLRHPTNGRYEKRIESSIKRTLDFHPQGTDLIVSEVLSEPDLKLRGLLISRMSELTIPRKHYADLFKGAAQTLLAQDEMTTYRAVHFIAKLVNDMPEILTAVSGQDKTSKDIIALSQKLKDFESLAVKNRLQIAEELKRIVNPKF